jgi:site-specific DNA recombinase
MSLNNNPLRFAAYIRVSHEEQRGNFSLASQENTIKDYVAAQGGTLVKIYADIAETATKTANRDEFLLMRQDAKDKKWDALVVAKFDRLNRNRMDAIAVKSLLRRDLGIKIFSATELSEDSDSAVGGLIEGILENLAEWYSKNLSDEFRKGKRQVWSEGRYNGGKRLFGYTVGERLVLQPKPDEVPGVLLAYESYATGKYGFKGIALILNNAGYKSVSGRQFTSECVREILKNPTFIGLLPHQETRQDSSGMIIKSPVELSQGAHEPIVPLELWEQVQAIRKERTNNISSGARKHAYLLIGLVYCWHCCSDDRYDFERDISDFGKCYCWSQHQKSGVYPHYYCKSPNIGYECSQKRVRTEKIDNQVLDVLRNLRLPQNWRDKIIHIVASDMNDNSLEQRLAEIRAAIERIDFRWDQGFFMSKEEYIEKRTLLQVELDTLHPMLVDDNLAQAADLLENFGKHLEACEGDLEMQNALLRRIVEQVYIEGERLIAITFKGAHHLLLTEITKMPTVFTGGQVLLASNAG